MKLIMSKLKRFTWTEAVDIKRPNSFRDTEVHAIIDGYWSIWAVKQKKNSKSGRYSEWYQDDQKGSNRSKQARKNLTVLISIY